jgi:hypothetical protein
MTRKLLTAAAVFAVAPLAAAALGGCLPDRAPTDASVVVRRLAVHPVEQLLARPAPLDAPESYLWTDRDRFQTDLAHHVADLHRQADVLRTGLSSAAGPAPQEMLRHLRRAEDRLLVELARLSVATSEGWPGVRLEVLAAVAGLSRAIERARRAASPGVAAAITI